MTKHQKIDVLPPHRPAQLPRRNRRHRPRIRLRRAPEIRERWRLTAANFEPSIWYAIGHDGKVTVTVGKADMGQHIASTMAQLVAEELEVVLEGHDDHARLERSEIQRSDSRRRSHRRQLEHRNELRHDVPRRRRRPASRSSRPPPRCWACRKVNCRASKSRVHHAKSKKSLTYAQIVAERKGQQGLVRRTSSRRSS